MTSKANKSSGSLPSTTAKNSLQVGLIHQYDSSVSLEGENTAKYIGLSLASTGFAAKVYVIGVDIHSRVNKNRSNENDTAAIRADGVVVRKNELGHERYEETKEIKALQDCSLWILCIETECASTALALIQKRLLSDTKEKRKRVIVCLQPALRELQGMDLLFPKDIVLHGGACFHLTINKHGVLYPLSHGCYYIERLSNEKTDALFALDLLEATGFHVLSRRNIQALKWGHSMIRVFYYLNALTGQSVYDSLRDRSLRLVYLQVLYEMTQIFQVVTKTSTNTSTTTEPRRRAPPVWEPDCSACTYLTIHIIMVLLPLPNWLFNNICLRILDFGLSASTSGHSTIERDVAADRSTEFEWELKDVLDMAKRLNIPFPALETLQKNLLLAFQAKKGVPGLTGREILASIHGSCKASRAISRTFILKIGITLIATVFLILYLFS